jgi:hypothetical protein
MPSLGRLRLFVERGDEAFLLERLWPQLKDHRAHFGQAYTCQLVDVALELGCALRVTCGQRHGTRGIHGSMLNRASELEFVQTQEPTHGSARVREAHNAELILA